MNKPPKPPANVSHQHAGPCEAWRRRWRTWRLWLRVRPDRRRVGRCVRLKLLPEADAQIADLDQRFNDTPTRYWIRVRHEGRLQLLSCDRREFDLLWSD